MKPIKKGEAMSAMKVRQHGVAAALLVIIALLQMGCGAQSTTSPESVFPNQEPGEVILPPGPIPVIKLPTPVDFTATYYGKCKVFLSWSSPVEAVDAVLFLDGTEMSCQAASHEGYFDLCNKLPGPHTYTLRYTNGVLMGPAETLIVNIDPPVIDGSGGGHEPLPDQGIR